MIPAPFSLYPAASFSHRPQFKVVSSDAVDAFWCICLPGFSLQYTTYHSVYSIAFPELLWLALLAACKLFVSWFMQTARWVGPRTVVYMLWWEFCCVLGGIWFFFVVFWAFFEFYSAVPCRYVFSNSMFIYLDRNPNFLPLMEFICRRLRFEDTLTVLNKLSEKPDAVCRFVWLSSLKSLACLRLLSCFHFPGGWISKVLRAGYRCSSDKSQCSVILMHKHTSFGRILPLQLLLWSAGQLLSINHFYQKKRTSKDLSPLAYTQTAKRMLQHIRLVPKGVFSLT